MFAGGAAQRLVTGAIDDVARIGGCPFQGAGRDVAAATKQLLEGDIDAMLVQHLVPGGPSGPGAFTPGVTMARGIRAGARDALREVFTPPMVDIRAAMRQIDNIPVAEIPVSRADLRIRYHSKDLIRAPEHFNLQPAAIRRMEPFVSATPEMGGKSVPMRADIGDYGEPLSLALVHAGEAMQHIILRDLGEHLDDVSLQADRVLAEWTFQSDALRSALEGVDTLVHTSATLLSSRLEGLDARAALLTLADGGAHAQAAAGPFGFWAGMTSSGLAPATSVVVGDTGAARLSADVITATQQITRNRRAKLATGSGARGETLLGCPVLPMVAELAQDFINLAKRYLDNPLEIRWVTREGKYPARIAEEIGDWSKVSTS